MKKFGFLLLLFSVVMVSSLAQAQTYQLGADVALKVQYFRFMDRDIQDTNAENGVFIGIEAYKQLFIPNLYFGIETGWAGTSGSFGSSSFDINVDSDVTYVPIEFNAKYVVPLSRCFNLSLGGGISYNYFNLDSTLTSNFVGNFRTSASADDWVFGGQFFAGLDYRFNNLFAGVGVKYQLTEDLTLHSGGFSLPTNTSADNLRIGMQLGLMF